MKYLLLAPAVILCVIFTLWPMAEVVSMSMQKMHILGDTFVGLKNYARLLTDRAFLQSLLNSLWYTALAIPMQIGLALVITMSATGLSKRWQDTTRFVFFIPTMAAGIIIASVWEWIFHRDGPVNWLMGTKFDFFTQSITAIPAISIVNAVSGIGAMVIMLLASTLTVNRELYDAARIDGATDRQIKWRIVLPIIMPMVWICVLLAAIGAPQVIEYVIALAPYQHSATVAFNIYTEAFILGRYGPAAAKAMILLVWMVALAWGKTRITREA